MDWLSSKHFDDRQFSYKKCKNDFQSTLPIIGNYSFISDGFLEDIQKDVLDAL